MASSHSVMGSVYAARGSKDTEGSFLFTLIASQDEVLLIRYLYFQSPFVSCIRFYSSYVSAGGCREIF